MKQGKASGTARLIAAATIFRDQAGPCLQQGPPGAAAWCRKFLSTSRTDRMLRWSVERSLGRGFWTFLESMLLPQIVSHWMGRKREIDRLARQAAAEGYTQLVVLGAGLDTLAFRLAEQHVFERVVSADHPGTLSVVRAAASGCTPPGIELVAVDLARPEEVEGFVTSRAVDASRPTLVVVEGVLMYLHEPAVAGLLRSLATHAHGRSRLIATVMVTPGEGSPGFAGQSSVINGWLSFGRERMLWGCDVDSLPAYLNELGWADARVSLVSGVRGGLENAGSVLASERLVIAERGSTARPAS